MLNITYEESRMMFEDPIMDLNIKDLIVEKKPLICGCTGKEEYAHGMCREHYMNFEE